MGTWDEGLLDNDAAHDGLSDLTHGIVEDIVAFGTAKPTQTTAEKLGAAVGALLQLSPFDFSPESESPPKIAAALAAQSASIAKLPPAARKVLGLIADGKGPALAERPAKMNAAHVALLSKGAKRSRFGLREPALFESTAAKAYVQSLANRCVEVLDEDFEDESNWSDLCREAMGMGLLGALMVLEPCKISAAKLQHWRKAAARGLAELRDNDDGELEFHEPYYANLDKVFAVLLARD